MTSATAYRDTTADLDTAVDVMQQMLPGAKFGVPAAALGDDDVAAWARAHAVTVCAHDRGDLEVLWRSSIRPVQVVLRCGSDPDTLREAVHAGVSRFVVCTAAEADLLAHFAHRTKYLYLGAHAPVPHPHRRLEVIGVHCDVDDCYGRIEWACATEQMLCRLAYLRSCGLRPARLSLTGPAQELGHMRGPQDTAAIAASVRDALDDGCRRWGLPRPKLLVAPGALAGDISLAA